MTPTRSRWQGMLSIVRFNWPLYAAALAALLIASGATVFLTHPWLRFAAGIAALGAAYFGIVSLGVSHLIYDRSDLYRWHWLERALAGRRPSRIAVCHGGFDEVSAALHDLLQPREMRVLDHHDPLRMTEASIHRARRLYPPTPGTDHAAHDHWPLADRSVDVVFGLLAIHEFRRDEERAQWFSEAKRCLAADGRIIVAEHLRDAANFIAYGPGALHFHSAASWRRSWEMAGLTEADRFSITPWVRVFVLTSP
jgi:SAM-dependent methyltransferase